MLQKMPGFSRNIWIAAVLMLLLAGVFIQYTRLERLVDTRNDQRNQSLQLANALRQSSDDLTRMVRTYVVTGDPVYKQQYHAILDIRNGKTPRPAQYQGADWDLTMAPNQPQASSTAQAVALLDLLRDAGCTTQELDKLTQAKALSDALSHTEIEAMRLAEKAAPSALADRAQALSMVHDAAYHQAKARIMQPIHAFQDMVHQRTTLAVQSAQAHATVWRLAFIGIGLGLVAFLVRTSVILRNALGGNIEEVQAHLARIGQGDFATAIALEHAGANSVLAGLAQTQRNLSRVAQERQAAQNARLEAMREAQTLMDAINMYAIVSITDPSGKIIFANDMFSQVSGYSNAELIGQNHRIVKSDAQPQSYWDSMWKTISSGYTWHDTVCNRAKDGSPYWVDSVIVPFFGENGIEKYISIRNNITPIKLAEIALKESAATLRDNAAFLARAGRIAGVGRWQFNLLEETLDWSDQTCQIHDVAPATRPTLQQSIDFFAPEARDNIQNAIDAAMRTGRPWDLELPLITAMNRRIWVRTAGEAQYQDGKRVCLVGIFQDVSQRRKLEDEVRQKNMLMENILSNLPVGLSVFDSQLNLLVDNQLFRTLLELPDSLFEGEVTHFESIIRFNAERGEYGDTDREASIRGIVERARLARPHHFQHERANGHTLEIRGAPLPDGGFVTTYADVTDLARATQAAQEASRSKSQFVANMSHEIRTPMNAILGMLQLLHNTALTERQLDYTAKAEGAAKSLLGLLNDVLDFSKIEADKMTLDPQPFHVERLMRDLAVILSANVGNKPVEVLFELDPDIPAMLVGDAMRLQQILINLGGNAIKFTSAGRVCIQVKAVSQTTNDFTLRVAVIDSGIGIAAENQEHIFDGFSQAEASTTRRFGGTGLGLSICKRLVELMGGTLELSSALDQGSTFHFTLTLPVAPVQEPVPMLSHAHLHANSGARLAGLRVLVVEDNPLNQQVAQELLTAEGAVIDLANNGQLGVDAVARAIPPYDVVLMDLQMPVMDGYAATRAIRTDLGLTQLPIIAMTANALASDRAACAAAGMNDHVGKPFDIHHLVAVVCAHVHRPYTLPRQHGQHCAPCSAGPHVGPAQRRLCTRHHRFGGCFGAPGWKNSVVRANHAVVPGRNRNTAHPIGNALAAKRLHGRRTFAAHAERTFCNRGRHAIGSHNPTAGAGAQSKPGEHPATNHAGAIARNSHPHPRSHSHTAAIAHGR
ncbi:MAG: PAS-domain containing protein [Burkholderiales bacterium]|nr:PAS-domain containing protein [Burkholderiales bacterium]